MKAILLIALTVAATGLDAAPLKIELPVEKPRLKDAPGRDALMGSCLVCHSVDYISTQPPLDAAGWKKIVEKMQHTFGAPLVDAQVPDLVNYLSSNYGPKPKSEPGEKKSGAP